MKPKKYFTICYIDNGLVKPFETHQFGEPNNWFETEVEAEQWIMDMFLDAPLGEVNKMALIVLPVFLIKFKPVG